MMKKTHLSWTVKEFVSSSSRCDKLRWRHLSESGCRSWSDSTCRMRMPIMPRMVRTSKGASL